MMRLLKGIWRVLSGISRFITVLLPLIFVAIFFVAVSSSLNESTSEPLPQQAGLLIAPNGPLVEDVLPVEPVSAFLNQDYYQPMLLNDVVRAIRWAKTDDRITSLVLDLENLAGPSTSQTVEISDAIAEFKEAGKPVIAFGDFYSQAHYLLASQADHILLHPEGGMFLEGFSVYRSYLRTFLEKIRVTMHVFRAGESKSAVEPYLRDDMSATEREIVTRWLGELWSAYTELAESGRDMPEGEMDRFIASFGKRLAASNNNLAETVIAAGWVDSLADHAEIEAVLAKWVGATDEDGDAELVRLGRYVDDQKAHLAVSQETLPLVAIIPVEGTIVPGDSEDGMAGSDTIVGYIDTALEAEDLAAVVLRVNSPGGSVFASDLIRRKLAELLAADIPLVVSMGSVAASGGYWISAEADEIWALPSTITGSIGAFSAFPTIEGIIDYIGVTVDGVRTTPLAGEASLGRGLSSQMANIVQALSYGVYDDFIELVATGREMSESDVRKIAEGIVWTGTDAREIGLVDQLGGLKEAVASAAALAGVKEWRTGRTQLPPPFETILLEELSRSINTSLLPAGGWFKSLAASFKPVVKGLSTLRDPMHVYVQCLSCAPIF